MLDSEKLGIAAHLHVLLRRKTGRVTDTEWMASNAEYATEIIKFARARAVEDKFPELADMADKLASAMSLTAPLQPVAVPLSTVNVAADRAADIGRYIRGIR